MCPAFLSVHWMKRLRHDSRAGLVVVLLHHSLPLYLRRLSDPVYRQARQSWEGQSLEEHLDIITHLSLLNPLQLFLSQ
jgi:hypothetical protein